MNNNNTPKKQNLWVIEAVEKLSGKSIFNTWSPDRFSEFLIVLMRYGNQTLFKQLATILKLDQNRITEFWKHVEAHSLYDAIDVLEKYLLLNRPENWTQQIFIQYLEKQINKLNSMPEYYNEPKRAFGKIETRAYLLHVETEYFNTHLVDMTLSSAAFREVVEDWQEIINQNTESKNQYLRKNILEKIINRAVIFQNGYTVALAKEKSDINVSSRNNTISILSEEVQKNINQPIMDILWKDLPSFNREDYVRITVPFFRGLIALNRTNYGYCENNLWPLLRKAYALDKDEAKNVIIKSASRLWLKEQIRAANTIYGSLTENDD